MYWLLYTRCCYVGVERQRERERKVETVKRGTGERKEPESLRGSVGNSARRRVVNFRLHRRAALRLPWSTFLSFFCTLFLPLSSSFSLSLFLLARFVLRSRNCSPTQRTPRLPSYSSRAYDSASLRLNAYADCR